jgi:hypothetical protein
MYENRTMKSVESVLRGEEGIKEKDGRGETN